MSSVWLCSRGEYEDARVVAVFSREQDAQTAAGLFGWCVEEMPLDAALSPPWPEGKRPFNLQADTLSFARGVPHCSAGQADRPVPLETVWKDFETYSRGTMWAADQAEAHLEANRKLRELLVKRGEM